ncbi:secretion system protein E [Arsukibacterium ikkense]|uniref:Secretion system protein E n=1 Tax=Arsukibacterium ikkense TaxID=336831 RepID=A0A0M2VBI0_9GAMM|nr:GspE/PulE family protein [Arsukibacterium ikkense]KKO46975.1 secretion system protein E [Arsukibacterium ikkense]
MTEPQILLQEHFQISTTDIEKAVVFQKKYGGRLEQILINMGAMSEDSLPLYFSNLLDIPLLSDDMLQQVSPESLQSHDLNCLLSPHDCFVLAHDDTSGKYSVAMLDPLAVAANQQLTERNVAADFYVATLLQVQLLRQHYAQNSSALNITDDLMSDVEEDRLRELAGEAPTVNLLNSLISRALRARASDMHLEPMGNRYRVRFRIDGVLQEADWIPPRMRLPVASRLKILSGMDIAEKRRPQDGKIAMRISNEDLDIRVSSLPLHDGESIVMRFLRQDSINYSMDVLGLSADTEAFIREDIKKTSGVILLTGPTGSGKTTSLYTFLNAINEPGVKIITLEDPVEYQLEGVNQVQVQSAIGFDFAAGLRSIVRQDPDIIMLGEIRDKETAQIAMQSALTGHLVFSTVHTNDAPSAYTRLLDLGAEEYLLNAAIVSIIAQRLVRKLCSHCAVPHADATAVTARYGLAALSAQYQQALNLQQAVGCEACAHTGYRGRIAIIEYLRCDDDIKSLPKDENFPVAARKLNIERGGRTLLQDGLLKAIVGQTTIEEVIRVAG